MSDNEPNPTAPAVIGATAFAAVPGVEHVAIAGELSAGTMGALESALASVGPDTLVVVLDLSAVTSLDDDARRKILAARSRLRAQRRRMLVMASASLRLELDAPPKGFEPKGSRAIRVAAPLPRARGRSRTVAPRGRRPRRDAGH